MMVNTMCEFRECRWTPVSKQLMAVGGPGGEPDVEVKLGLTVQN